MLKVIENLGRGINFTY